jgi:SAM-dependent methyltransferase
MPSIEDNRNRWGKEHAWEAQGDEWSTEWGGAETQWHATILPRIRRLVPAGRVLEFAPGFGRWSRFLIDCADEYIGVDMNPNCVSACRTRFASASHATFVVNDGKSLAAVGDDSIDFAFSFDSLVHVEIDVIEAYLRELSRKLSPDGIAFIHHSNLGEINRTVLRLSRRLSRTARGLPLADVLRRLRLIDIDHWRAPSVTSWKVVDVGKATGLVCIGQELIDWGHQSRRMIDCLSILTRSGSRWERPNVVVRNPYFVAEAFSAHAISEVYTTLAAREGLALRSRSV